MIGSLKFCLDNINGEIYNILILKRKEHCHDNGNSLRI